ncbi:hypothetical protein [Mycobacterium simiae]|uniref:hypothetical protein n=1 Tax=Mycobacterium simiae TaxID=1784 RepID=UPI00165F1F9B|nr:hypothetical protein [Mycobacterium simiae]
MGSVTPGNGTGGTGMKAHHDDDQQPSSNDGRKVNTPQAAEPSAVAKETAAQLMAADDYRPMLVLPGSSKTITGTAVNDLARRRRPSQVRP